MAAYVRFGVDAGHLLAASVMSAPAALVVALLAGLAGLVGAGPVQAAEVSGLYEAEVAVPDREAQSRKRGLIRFGSGRLSASDPG